MYLKNKVKVGSWPALRSIIVKSEKAKCWRRRNNLEGVQLRQAFSLIWLVRNRLCVEKVQAHWALWYLYLLRRRCQYCQYFRTPHVHMQLSPSHMLPCSNHLILIHARFRRAGRRGSCRSIVAQTRRVPQTTCSPNQPGMGIRHGAWN